VGILSWSEYRHFSENPVSIHSSEIPEKVTDARYQWVSISGVYVDCELGIREAPSDRAQAVFVDEAKNFAVIAEYSSKLPKTCDELTAQPLVGTIQPITDWRYSAISHRWPELSRDFKQTQIYDLCAFCGRPNSWTGVMLGLVGSLAGLLLYPICLIENKLNKRKAITNALKHALQRLVESPALQQKRVTEELVDDGTDISDDVREVMTSFLTNYADALQDFSNRFGKRIKPHQQQALDRLSGHTNEMLQQGDSSLLQIEALQNREEWEQIRLSARACLEAMRWPVQPPPPLIERLPRWLHRLLFKGSE
jgi:gas vesicle protein